MQSARDVRLSITFLILHLKALNIDTSSKRSSRQSIVSVATKAMSSSEQRAQNPGGLTQVLPNEQIRFINKVPITVHASFCSFHEVPDQTEFLCHNPLTDPSKTAITISGIFKQILEYLLLLSHAFVKYSYPCLRILVK